MRNRDMLNRSGYMDMTAYIALRNIEKDEKNRKHKNSRSRRPNRSGNNRTENTNAEKCAANQKVNGNRYASDMKVIRIEV